MQSLVALNKDDSRIEPWMYAWFLVVDLKRSVTVASVKPINKHVLKDKQRQQQRGTDRNLFKCSQELQGTDRNNVHIYFLMTFGNICTADRASAGCKINAFMESLHGNITGMT